ncbi:Ig-like domain-containing protein [Myxococcus sp. CA033]|uniref:Ig-like domain-containing protein n=1 Tax=Myxococcus sp. CA033 TaxID=2741516 RepID=UPI00157B7809|nr:Ig-like domain-containing protein [Myxococcus sp. CA033]NTX38258.1 Ig-like domain-containing protein [Myxococcus sp. CA033]
MPAVLVMPVLGASTRPRHPRSSALCFLLLLLALAASSSAQAASLPWHSVLALPLAQCPPTAAPVPFDWAPRGEIATTTPQFGWTAVPGATSYTLYVLDAAENFVVHQTNIPQNTFTPTTPLPERVPLRWKVKAESSCGPGPYSESLNFIVFTTPPCPPYSAPVGHFPHGEITNPRPTFSWTAVRGATSYTLYVFDPAENQVIRKTDLTQTSFTPTSDLPGGIQLRWKVKAESPCGPGPYSPDLFFRVPGPPPPPSVRIVSPADESTVTASQSVQVQVSSDTSFVEFYVDGVYLATQSGGGTAYNFPWNPAVNPLPAPNHAMQLGYYFADGRYGNFKSEVSGYTNLYYAWARRGYEPNTDAADSVWLPLMQSAVASAAAEGWNIQLNLNLQETTPGRVTPLDAVLNLMAPHWNRVARIELASGPDWSRAELEGRILDLRSRLNSRGLATRPMGVIYSIDQARTLDAVFATGLDFVTIEAFLDGPGHPISQGNIGYLYDRVSQAKAHVPTSKQLVLVIQSDTRNGTWTNLDNLRDLQLTPYYHLAANDPRVVALTLYTYGRPQGARENPVLKPSHMRIAEKLFGTSIPGSKCGRRTLTAAAYNALGQGRLHNVEVTVAGPGCP